jgi:hypothetical protein
MKPHATPLRALAAAAACALSLAAVPAVQESDSLRIARETLERWVETRRVISKERRDWAVGREMLNDRIELVQREIESLRGKIADAERSIAEADKSRQELVDESAALDETSAVLVEVIARLEERTRALLPRLPEPIRARVRPLSQQLPEDPQKTKQGLGDRFRNVVGILNEVNKFNREITVTSEVRALLDGTSAEVTALYVGIGQAYYVTADGKAAGIGSASSDGWTWTPANESAADVTRAIEIYEAEQPADFVRLPIRIE